MRKMTRKDAQHRRKRRSAVNARGVEELRAMSFEDKMRQLAELMSTPVSAEWLEKREAEVKIIRERWLKLYKAYGCLD